MMKYDKQYDEKRSYRYNIFHHYQNKIALGWIEFTNFPPPGEDWYGRGSTLLLVSMGSGGSNPRIQFQEGHC